MKILLSTNYQPPRPESGGIEYAALELRACWEAEGHEVTWITSDIPPTKVHPQPRSIRVPAGNTFQRQWGIDVPLFSPFWLPRIARAVREHDVVNTHSLTPGLTMTVLYFALKYRKPVVVTQHVPVIRLHVAALNALQKHVLCWGARWCTRCGAILTFVSPAVRDWFVEHAKPAANRIRITPVGINQSDFRFVGDEEKAALKRKWGLPEGKLHAIFVGRYEEKKGIQLLHEIAAAVPEVHFILRGQGSIDVNAWSLPNVQEIRYASQAELRELYGASDLLVLPSFGEGWPAVVPQAMACGTACMISPEAFQGYNRDPELFLVRPRTLEAWSTTLREAAAGRIPLLRERQRLSDYSRQTWDWKKTADQYLQLFEECRRERQASAG